MSLLRNMLMAIGGGQSRNKGMQLTGPGHYSYPAATNVTVESAMQLSAVWACVRIITETIGSLPIVIYDVDKDGVKTINTEHPLSRLFRGKVNRWQTRQEYMESIVYQFVMQGNDYSAIQRNGKDEIIALVPLMTPQMQVYLEDSGAVEYRYQDGVGLKIFSDKSIFHNKLFGNGIVGLSPIAYARNSIAIGQAAEQSTSKIYKNGGKPSGLLMYDKLLSDKQREAIKKNFADMAEGNEDRLFVLEADMKYEQVSLSPQDIELLASRRFQIEDCCRFFGVPSVLVNDKGDSSKLGSSIGEIIQGFYKFGLRPYTTRYASSMEAQLLTPAERATMKIEFDLTALLRPDQADRIKSGKEGVTGGILTPNEVRYGEGLPPVNGGDNLYLQQQMTPLDTLATLDRTKNPAQSVPDKENDDEKR